MAMVLSFRRGSDIPSGCLNMHVSKRNSTMSAPKQTQIKKLLKFSDCFCKHGLRDPERGLEPKNLMLAIW